MAGYLSFKDVGQFRLFRFNPVVLTWYQFFAEHCHGKKADGVLDLLTSLQDLDTELASSFDEILERFPLVTNDTGKRTDASVRATNSSMNDYRVASVLLQMSKDIDEAADLDEVLWAEAYAIAAEEIKALKGVQVPAIQTNLKPCPKMGPLEEYGEQSAERYLRAWNILKSIDIMFFPSTWKSQFEGKEDTMFRTVVVNDNQIPPWMRPSSATDPMARPTLTPKRRPMTFFLYLDRDKKSRIEEELCQHEESHITYNSLELPSQTMRLERDPRAYSTGEMWRDTIRRQLQFPALKVDFHNINAIVSKYDNGEDSASYTLYDALGKSTTLTSWSSLLRELEGNEELGRCGFVYRLRPVEEDEEDYQFEYAGIPAAVEDDYVIGPDNDIELKPQETQPGSPASSPHSAPSGKPDDEMDLAPDSSPQPSKERDKHSAPNARAAAYVKFLLEGGDMKPAAPTPQMLFGPDRHEEMLDYYSGFDAWTEEGLHAWRIFICESVAAQMPVATLPKALKGIPKADRTALLDIKRLSDVNTLTQEVRARSQFFIPV